MTASIPAFEEARLATLRSLRLLDTLPEPEFDDVVEAACAVMDVPIALVSLIDADRQWFKAKQGLEACETSRDESFCAHAILEDETLVVPDATLDPRFADNLRVTGDFGLRFYAGAPIVVDGLPVGTLCCLDTRPRYPTGRQISALAALARQVAALLRARLQSETFAESERRFVAFLDHAPAVAYLKDETGRMRFVNQRFGLVYDGPSVLGRRDAEWLPPEVAAQTKRHDDAVRESGHAAEFEEHVPLVDGTPRTWQSFKFPVEVGGRTWIGGVSIDVTALREAEAALRDKEARFRTVVESLHEGLVLQDETGATVLWNESAERLLGLNGGDLKGRTERFARWRTIREDGSELPAEERPAARARRDGVASESVLGIFHEDGTLHWISVHAAPVLSDDGRTTSVVASFLDVTERKAQEARIREHLAEIEAANARLEGLATTDGLTGLRNHRFFQDFLRRKIEHCEGVGLPLSIALLDVDRFKAYNDDFGHQAGDAVLQAVAEALEGAVRPGDLVARYGGEEFVIVMPGADARTAGAIAERARRRLKGTPFDLRSVTASFGVATLGSEAPDAPRLIRAADDALYRSKAEGRNRVTPRA